MKKYNNSFSQNTEKNEHNSKNNKLNHNSIINKLHSIQESISSNNTKSKYVKRKNNFRRPNDIREQQNLDKNKNKNKVRSKSKIKNYSKIKSINVSHDIRLDKNNSQNHKINHQYNYNNSITEPNNYGANNTNNNFYTNNTTNNGVNTNNNIIITINNYNKITPVSIDQSSKTLPLQKPKDKDFNNRKKDLKKVKVIMNNDNNKNHIKKMINKNKKDNDKKVYNSYINGYNLSLDNNGQNNTFLNQIINNKDRNNNYKTNNNNDNIDNNDNISINTFNTINDNNNITSSNTSKRENSNRILIKKNVNYQDNIMLKKKQLGMYSPLSFLKKNFDVPNKNMNDKFNNKTNSFNSSEKKNQYDVSINTNNDIDIDNQNNKNIDDNKDIENNININNEINKKKDNKYYFNYYNINKNKNTENNNNEVIPNTDSNATLENNSNNNPSNNNNKNQVRNIISTLNRIKNTKQIYNNKKAFNFTKIHRKKEKLPLYNINNNSFLKSKPSYSRLVERNINNHFFYNSRSYSKNVLNNRTKNLNQKFYNFIQKRASKSNQKLIERSFIVEPNKLDKKKSTNELLLSYQKKRNKMYIFKNANNSKNIKSEYTYNANDKKKANPDINDSMTLNSSINSTKNFNNYSSINNIESNISKTVLNKNNTSNAASISTNIGIPPSNDNNIIDDAYENTTIANINKHCDTLLSRINQKMREEKEKEKENNTKDNEDQVKNNDDIYPNKIINKKIISNASLCRRGLNRPDEMMKINQDTLFKVKFGDINYSYYGVCDGHGPSGHFVSDFIKSNIAFIVYKQLKSLLLQNHNNIANLVEADDSNIDFPQLFKDCFLLMDTKLNENKSIDIELSGTTCVSLLFCENRIISANVGDSRAIKGYFNSKKNIWNYIALSRDHKPSDKSEAERIKKNKGIIHPYIDDEGNYAGPERVWIDDELPGLAMSRSFGDEIASRVGVYSEPEVKIFPFKEEDKFIVIASDGLWEYVSNDEVVNIVSGYFEKKDCDGAVSKLYEVSHERWVQYDDYIDDISIIVVFLD